MNESHPKISLCLALTDNVESPDNEEPTQNESDEGDNPENNDATHFDDATADNEKANLSHDRIEDHDSEPTFAAPITSGVFSGTAHFLTPQRL
jgi:hypothetical protein